MAYQVIARRWRPQSFDEVVYQDHISKTLQHSIENGRISHAYIFAGPRGVGKTTSARIFAKSLNCVNGPTPTPCGVCDNCVEIKEGRSFDVIEIDGASNNSVDDIRELREKVNFAPVKGRYKVYIIDEVHMLSTSAFNALLKTLEEPPAHVVFIFATTEMHKLPETILSRCQKFFFKKITAEAIAAHLAKIVKDDGFDAEESALYAVARAGDGSMRDAQSLLEQVLSFSKEKITEKDVLSQLGIVSLQSYLRLFNSIASVNSKDLISEISAVASAGADMARYSAGIADIIRGMRLVKNGVVVREAAGFSAEESVQITEAAAKFCDEELSGFYRIVLELLQNIRYLSNEQACVEMALLDMLALRSRPSLSAILAKLENVKTSYSAGVLSSQQNSVKQGSDVSENAVVEKQPSRPVQEPVAEKKIEPVEDAVPLPDIEELKGATDYSEYEKDHPVVDKIKDIFHGEVIEKKGE